jgi:hypothetical protein
MPFLRSLWQKSFDLNLLHIDLNCLRSLVCFLDFLQITIRVLLHSPAVSPSPFILLPLLALHTSSTSLLFTT